MKVSNSGALHRDGSPSFSLCSSLIQRGQQNEGFGPSITTSVATTQRAVDHGDSVTS